LDLISPVRSEREPQLYGTGSPGTGRLRMEMKKVRVPSGCWLMCLVLLLSLPCAGQDTLGGSTSLAATLRPTTTPVTLQFSLFVPSDAPLWDTGITVRAGDSVEISSAPGICASSGIGGHEELLESLP